MLVEAITFATGQMLTKSNTTHTALILTVVWYNIDTEHYPKQL